MIIDNAHGGLSMIASGELLEGIPPAAILMLSIF
jgi:hypothetical protein